MMTKIFPRPVSLILGFFFRKRFSLSLSLSYTHNHRKKKYIIINSPIPVNIRIFLSYLYRYYFTYLRRETKTYSSFQKSNKNIKWPYFCIVYYIFSLISISPLVGILISSTYFFIGVSYSDVVGSSYHHHLNLLTTRKLKILLI